MDTVLSMSNYELEYTGIMPDSIFAKLDSAYLIRDSFYEIDTMPNRYLLNGNDTIFSFYLLDDNRLFIDSNYSTAIYATGLLSGGTYKLYTEILDTFYQKVDTASVTLIVVDKKSPAVIKPYDYRKIHVDNIANVNFEFTKKQETSLYYQLQVVIVDTADWLEPLEYLFTNSPTFIINQSLGNNPDSVFQLGNMMIPLLPVGPWLAWSVRAYNDSLYTSLVADNEGLSTPFTFALTDDTAYLNFSRRSGGHPWHCEWVGGGFESGMLDGWRTFTAKRPQNPYNSVSLLKSYKNRDNIIVEKETFDNTRHIIVSSTASPYLGNVPKVPVNGKNYAFQIGNETAVSGNGDAAVVSYTFTPTSIDAIIKLNYLYYLSEGVGPGHEKIGSNSIIRIRASRGAYTERVSDIEGITLREYGIPTNDAKRISGVLYSEWRCRDLDFSKYIGQTVTLEFASGDCTNGGHYGMIAIDFCSSNTAAINYSLNSTYCKNDPIIIDASSSVGLENWLYTVEESNSIGGRIGLPEYISDWYSGTTVFSNFDLRRFLSDKGTEFQCGKYYRIKVAGNNACSQWTENVKVIHISCPGLNAAGPYRCCLSGVCNLNIGSAPILGYVYNWVSAAPNATNCLSSLIFAAPSFSAPCAGLSFPVTYELQVFDGTCLESDEVTIYKDPPTIISIDSSQITGCGKIYKAIVNSGIYQLEWKIFYTNGPTLTYYGSEYTLTSVYIYKIEVTAKNICGNSTTVVFNVSKVGIMAGDFPILTHNALLVPNRIKNLPPIYLKFYDVTKPAAAINSYNATGYRMELLNRSGGITVVKEEYNKTFKNGDIFWDGTLPNNIKLVSGQEYHMRLVLLNCTYKTTLHNNLTYRYPRCKSFKIIKKKFLGIKYNRSTSECEEYEFLDKHEIFFTFYYE